RRAGARAAEGGRRRRLRQRRRGRGQGLPRRRRHRRPRAAGRAGRQARRRAGEARGRRRRRAPPPRHRRWPPAREPRRRPRRRRRGGARAEGLSLQASLSRPVILRSGATKDLRPMCRWPHGTSVTPELDSCGNLRFLRSAQDGRTGEGWRPRRLARPGVCTIFPRMRARRAAAGPYLVDSPSPPAMTLRTALAAGLLLAAPLASAQKPAERSPLDVGQDYVEVTSRDGSDLLVAADGTPRAIYHPNYAVRPAEPEAMARQYLAENAALLRLEPTLDDLALRAVREGLAGTTVRFTQTVRGVPVYGPDLVVSIDRQHRVQFVLSPYRPGLTLPAA